VPDHIKKEITKLRAEVDALLAFLPVAQKAIVRPVLLRLLGILDDITGEL
jgi:hypothetical protein